MLDLGPDAPAFHSDLSQHINASEIDLVFTCGSLMLNLYKSIPEKLKGALTDNARGLGVLVSNEIQQGDVVAVEGDKFHHGGGILCFDASYRLCIVCRI